MLNWLKNLVSIAIFAIIILALIQHLLNSAAAVEPGDPLFSAQNGLVAVTGMVLVLLIPTGLKLLQIVIEEV